MPNKNWEKEILPHIKERISDFHSRGIKPTLRTLFYSLVSLNVIENTLTNYKQLSDFTVKKREKNVIPIDCFTDDSRKIIQRFNDRFTSREDYVDKGILYLKNASSNYINTIPRWHNQPNYVEVWIEKEAMAGTFFSILKDKEVRIVPTRGFSSITFIYDNVQRLKRIKGEGKTIFIRYFGDFDPSGEEIENTIKGKFQQYQLSDINFKRIAIDETHVSRFELPDRPDAKTLDKLEKDPRSKSFKRKYGRLFQVELDALQAYAPEEFKYIITQSVDSLFDENKYYNRFNIDKNEISGLVQKKIKELINGF